mmetsp:Transcript_113505/g.321169  ORF Transcript_113505/g.321169 Transcript_113505/m.321169 type:complete len:308 (-) Transcript_113505:138-1061(-)
MGCHGSHGVDNGLVDKLLFPAPSPSYEEWSFKEELLWVPLAQYGGSSGNDGDPAAKGQSDDYSFPCRLFQNPAAGYLVLYFQRNAEDLGKCKLFCNKLKEAVGVHVLVVEYPGYGICSACAPSAAQAKKHAVASLNFVRDAMGWPLDRVIIFGYCVGTGPAVHIAAQSETAGVVLVTPFLSVRKMLKGHVGPIASLATEAFPIETLAPHIRSPTLIFHGQSDKLVSVSHARKLCERLQCKKELLSPADTGHKDSLIRNDDLLFKPMIEFFGLSSAGSEPVNVPAWASTRHTATDHGPRAPSNLTAST